MNVHNIIVLDVETGGFECTENPITQLALKVVEPARFTVLDKYDTLVKPYNNLKITQGAIDSSQIDIHALESRGILHKQLYKDFKAILSKYSTKGKYAVLPMFAGHNFQFDIKFLEYLFAICDDDLYKYVDRTFLCTMRMMKFREATRTTKANEIVKYNLSAVCERLGIKLKSAHGAPADVDATLEALKVLLTAMRGEAVVNSSETKEEQKTRKNFQFKLKQM